MFMINELLLKNLDNRINTNTSDIQAIRDGEIYSSTETKTNKKWFGKDVYRKELLIDSPVLQTTTDYQHGIQNIEKIKIVEMFVIRKSDGASRPINIAYNGGTLMAQAHKTSISYRIPTDLWNWSYASSAFELHVVVEYTKTTN